MVIGELKAEKVHKMKKLIN